MDDKKIYKEALDKYGAQMQETICIEELSELQKALCKNIRGKGSMEDISEEIADVQIMLAQMILLLIWKAKWGNGATPSWNGCAIDCQR